MGREGRGHLVSVSEVSLHVRFPAGQCLLSKDCIAGGRFLHSKLCSDLHVDDALVCRVIIVFVW